MSESAPGGTGTGDRERSEYAPESATRARGAEERHLVQRLRPMIGWSTTITPAGRRQL